ncbi:MAG: hypothetical protein ING33_10030, partial [Rhodocyclaceae bacterium]|nr:hypothetical protein [Rhodocyclaceae bacterium]
MNTPDPIAYAEVLLAYGRKKEALAHLRAAAASNPDRKDIRSRLEWLESADTPSGATTRTALPHLVLAWFLFLFSVVLCLGVFGLIGHPVMLWFFPSDGSELPFYGVMLLLGFIAAGGYVAVYGAVVLFLHLWFTYLNRLPVEIRLLVDDRSPRAINVLALE